MVIIDIVNIVTRVFLMLEGAQRCHPRTGSLSRCLAVRSPKSMERPVEFGIRFTIDDRLRLQKLGGEREDRRILFGLGCHYSAGRVTPGAYSVGGMA